MPQYEMDGKYEPAFTALDEFTQAYIEAMFWTEEAPGVSTEEWQATDEHDEGSIPSDVGFADLAPEALAVIIETCREFQESFKEELDLAYSMRDGYTPSSAGHDFWLTRNHHGAGFWDRGLDDVGRRLTEMSHPYGDADCYLGDDGKVYVS